LLLKLRGETGRLTYRTVTSLACTFLLGRKVGYNDRRKENEQRFFSKNNQKIRDENKRKVRIKKIKVERKTEKTKKK
jgi:hypothetical protein